MFCPNCGQEQISQDTRFCSRCGLLLSGVTHILANGGALPQELTPGKKKPSPRSRGLKQGLFIFLLAFLVVPLLAILTIMVNAEPFAVVISAILLTVGGLLRAAYALMFESNEPFGNTLEEKVMASAQNMLGKNKTAQALPPQSSIPVSNYVPPTAGNWRDTNDLIETSVTDETTKLLDKNK